MTTLTNRSMPPGIIIPELAYPDVETAVAWLFRAFGFKERLRIADHRAQLVFGEATLVVVGHPEGTALAIAENAWTHRIMVHIEDVNDHYARAQQAGARITMAPTDFPFGERQYGAEDFAGHRWTFSQTLADVDPADWGGILRGTA